MTEWHYRLNGHEFEQTLGDGDGQGRLECCSPGGHKESDMTQRLKKTYDKCSLNIKKDIQEQCQDRIARVHDYHNNKIP